MDNKVIGNKKVDNKQSGNRQVAESSSMMGKVPMQKADYFKPQNSPNSTPKGPDEKGDEGVKVSAQRAKKVIRKNTSFSDSAIKAAQNMRGMKYLRS